MRAGIETIIIPWKNQKDLLEIPEHYRKKCHFIPVKTVQEVFAIALVDWKAQELTVDKPVKKKEKKSTQIAA
jgi:ATP-dependent Lon protease